MRLLVIAAVIGCVLAAPDGSISPPGYSSGGSVSLSGPVLLGGSGDVSLGGGYGAPSGPSYGPGPIVCGPGQAPDGTGACVDAIVTRNVFVYAAPYIPQSVGPPPRIPRPRIDYNVVVVRTPEQAQAEDIIVPPPQQRTIVYVLTRQDTLEQQVIEIPGAAGQPPEVYYVNYRDGEDRQLKGGLSLQQILRQAGQQGGVISGGSVGGGGVIVGGGAGGVGSGGSGGYGAPPIPSYS